uniref:Retrovirus-related Pol polyprotein from transposon TNT 1-94 n=1 Tax=Tanacetum cinerariifolium TaxID=118510 RepID=A0A6L2MSC5_TANCI|nr:hypothetical protein [Tanacetum cinerariifolium]
MSSITTQQAKLDLELVLKVKRLEIRKCNRRLNPRKIQREPTFQVVLDALALTPCYSAFLITADVPEVYMHQFWDYFYKHDTFYRFKMDKRKRFILTLEIFKDIFKICPRVQGQDFDALLTNEDIVSFLRELGHTGKINSLNDTTGLDKLRLSRAQILWGATPPKIASKFKKATPSKKDLNMNLVPVDEEPKSAKKKVPTKKTTRKQTPGVVIRDTPVEPSSKSKEKVDVASGKGIELIFEVALTKEAQYEEVHKKSLRDFHKTHPSGSGIVTKTALSVVKIKISVTNKGTSIKLGVLDVTEEVLTESEPEALGKDKDDSNNEQDSGSEGSYQERDSDDDNTQSDSEKGSDFEHETDENESDFESDQEQNEKEIGDDEEEEDEFVRTPQLYDDIDIRLNKPVQADDDTVQKEGTDAELTNIQQGNENQEISQVIEDAHVTLFTLLHKTKVLVTSSSHSSDLASKFLNFSDIPHTNAQTVSPMDVHVHHEVPRKQTLILLTVPVSKPEFEVADLNMPQDQEENPSNDDEEPKGKVSSKRDWFTKPKRPQEPIDPDWNDEKTPKQGPTQSWLMTLAYSADKQSRTFDELMSTPIDFSAYIMKELKITNLTQETLLGPLFRLLKGTHTNYVELEYDFEEFMNGNRQMAPVDYFFNNDLKYLQGGISTMTYMTSFTKAAQYDLPVIEDMVSNIKSLVKVSYDKHALWGISHWRDQRKSFYGYARGLESTHDVYSTKRILAVTQNRLTDLSSDDVFEFSIALRMFTRSMVIQKRVEDIQLGVKSYQKKINITKPETTRPGIRKKDPYTSYQDPQGFIYVDTLGRNRLIRSDKLYKFSNDTLTRLRTSPEDITKNIHKENLPKRRWSTLETK